MPSDREQCKAFFPYNSTGRGLASVFWNTCISSSDMGGANRLFSNGTVSLDGVGAAI